MNTIRKMTVFFTPVLLTAVLAGCGRTLATTTPNASLASTTSSPASDSNASRAAQSIPDSTQIVAQGASIRDRGAIQFSSGATATSVANFVEGNGVDRYTFDASAGQPARINILSATRQVLLTLVAPDGTPLMRSQSGSASWSGTLPMSGTYRLNAVNQYVGSQYRVNLDIRPTGNDPTQTHDRGLIQFPAGGTFASVNGYLASQNIDSYRFNASAGQPVSLSVRSPNGQIVVGLLAPDGRPIARYQSGATSWSGKLPTDGIYQIVVVNPSSASSYRVGLSILP